MAEWLVNLQVEQLPEGCYLATCTSITGLVAQGRTLTETLEMARDVARQLHEARVERGEHHAVPALAKSFGGWSVPSEHAAGRLSCGR